MWFAFKFVSLDHWKQLIRNVNWSGDVVICFQICIFGPLKTTPFKRIYLYYLLWFAFKFVSLDHWKQRKMKRLAEMTCCDLLSNLYLWTIENNFIISCTMRITLWFAFKFVSLDHWKQPSVEDYASPFVVICFQICIFGPLKTTRSESRRGCPWLWFAFKFVSLDHWKQHLIILGSVWFGCDLLSNLYLWTIENNDERNANLVDFVVICFQICIFGPLKTTFVLFLWFWPGCDLLSNLYLWTIENNDFFTIIYGFVLWFAFKFVSLDHWKQRRVLRCFRGSVVICFQICIFGPLKTTANPNITAMKRCDLLSNLYLWTIENNRIYYVPHS